MLHPRAVLGVVALVLISSACGEMPVGQSYSIQGQLSDHDDTLSDEGDDTFFTLDHRGGDRLPADRLLVLVGGVGSTPWTADYRIETGDDGNDAFSEGDVLVVEEPGRNVFDTSDRGKTLYTAVFVENRSDSRTVDEAWNGRWEP